MYRWDPALALRSIRTEDIREITINRAAAWCLSQSLHCTLPAWLTCLNINPIVWRFRYRALTNPSSRPAFYLFWVVSKVDSGYYNNWERDGPGVVNLITYGQNVVINLTKSWSVSSSSVSEYLFYHRQFMTRKNVFMTRYLHKQVKNIASINTSWYLQCIHFCIGAQKPQRKVTASLIFVVSTFYPVHQGVRRENGEKLKCCEILSLRICMAPQSILQWSPAKQKKSQLLLASSDGHSVTHVWCHSRARNSEKNALIYPHLIVSKNECCSTAPGSVMAHKAGQFWWNYKTTRRNFGDSVRIYDSSPPPRKCYPLAEFLLRTQGIGGKYPHRQRQAANVASLSSALTISTFPCLLSLSRRHQGGTGEDI